MHEREKRVAIIESARKDTEMTFENIDSRPEKLSVYAISNKPAQPPGVSDSTCENVRIQLNDHLDSFLM